MSGMDDNAIVAGLRAFADELRPRRVRHRGSGTTLLREERTALLVAAADEIERQAHEIMRYQVGESYGVGYEHGVATGVNHASKEASEISDALRYCLTGTTIEGCASPGLMDDALGRLERLGGLS